MKRLIITESERAKILNMHGFKKMLSESTIQDVQNLLNTKFSSGLTPDGKYGPKTAAAIEKALGVGGTPAGTEKGTPAGTEKGTPNDGDIAGGNKGEPSSVD